MFSSVQTRSCLKDKCKTKYDTFKFNQFTISDNMFAPLTLNDLRLSYKNINGGEGILLKVCLTNYDCLIFLILKN